MSYRVIIVGAGPAGLYCADRLLDNGMDGKDILIVEAGKQMEERHCPQTSSCSCQVCDILEGIGGAGGFSDGKNTLSLTRGTQLENLFASRHESLMMEIDRKVVEYGNCPGFTNMDDQMSQRLRIRKLKRGSPLKFETYPLRHVGSDGIRDSIIGQANHLRQRGVTIRSKARVSHILNSSGKILGVMGGSDAEGGRWSEIAENVVIATGLQGAEWLERQFIQWGITTEPGPAGFGMRVEARSDVLEPLFSTFYDWKVLFEAPSGFLVRSFCCNHHGSIVNENHYTMGIRNVNGHSYLDPAMRTGSSNFAMIAKVTTSKADNPQKYVREVAREVNTAASGQTVVQLAKAFVNGRGTREGELAFNHVRTNFQAKAGSISAALPGDLYQAFTDYLVELDKAVPGVLSEDTLLYAPEMKYYGRKLPIDFATWRCTAVDGLYLLGNASGYVDSFISAALTGYIAADDITSQ